MDNTKHHNLKDDIRKRYAVRGLLLSPENKILLIETRTQMGNMWLVPGGGIERNEDPCEALARELYEELSFDLVSTPTEVWHRQFSYTSSLFGPTRQYERYFLVHTERFTPRFDNVPETREREALVRGVWWDTEDILASNHLLFAPKRIGELVQELIEAPPSSPITVSE